MTEDPLPGAPLVVQTHGYTPRLWQGRSVVFFANLLSLFYGNEEEGKVLAKEITGADSYGGRLLPLTGILFESGSNMLMLERDPDASLLEYFKGTLGLTLPEVRVLTHADYLQLRKGSDSEIRSQLIAGLRAHSASWIDAYVTDDTIVSLAAEAGMKPLCDPGASQKGNNKLLFHKFMESAGHPVFETRMANSAAEIGGHLAELQRCGYRRAGIKAAIGASGIGLMTAATSDQSLHVPDYFFHESECMVQGWLEAGRDDVDALASPSVQLFLDDESVYLYDLTEQILSDASIHQGNESPPSYLNEYEDLAQELFSQASDAGTWLHHQGYRGTASVDFLVAFKDAGFKAYGCEINARVTGATYPSVLARHYLPRGAWLMRNLRLPVPVAGSEVLQLLEKHNLLLKGDSSEGILPINFNLDENHHVNKGQFLCIADTSSQCHELLANADRDLAFGWGYDRD